MPLWPVQADWLPLFLHRPQPADHGGAHHEADDQSGHARRPGPERDVPKQVEENELVREGPENNVQHQAGFSTGSAAASIASTTFFMPLPRLPLTRIAPPSA